MNISQPAASKTIRELEALLDATLFDRSARRLQLTRAGKLFQQHAGAAFVELQRATDLVREAPKSETRISVGTLPTAATDLMPLAAIQFAKAQPECRIRVSTGPNWLLMSQLREGQLDMVVGRMASAQVMEGLSFRQLYAERIAAIVRPEHPLVQADDPMARLSEFPLMLPPSGAVISPLVRAYLSRIGLPAPQPTYETVSLAFGRRVVLESDTVWFISRGVVRAELDNGQLCSLEMKDDLLGGPVGVSLRDGGTLSAEQQGMLTALEAVARNLNPLHQ